jgi:membrane fusion protein (multidrug efflux system)
MVVYLRKKEKFRHLAVNEQTGSFNVGSSFPNANRLFLFRRKSIQIPTEARFLSLSSKCNLEMQDKRIALVVDKENKVKAVPITVRPVPEVVFS